MDSALFEQLLHEEESSTLDFKRDQYEFVKASDEQKSELLKDILEFANAWRRTEAYILIGVEEVRSGRSNVVGVDHHLDDHALQQLVNHLTNRPIQFQFEAFAFEGRQVGIIRIERQRRPFYIRRNFGKLRRQEVYVPALRDIRPAIHQEGEVVIEKNSDRIKVSIECGTLQPGRRISSDTFHIGIGKSGDVSLSGVIFAGNMPEPKRFSLGIAAKVTNRTLSVDQLFRLAEKGDASTAKGPLLERALAGRARDQGHRVADWL